MSYFTFSPLYQRLNRKQRGLLRAFAPVLGGAVGLLISAGATWMALLPPYFQTAPTRFPFEWLFRILPGISAIAASLALPIFLAYVTAFVTVSYIKSLEYPTLLVTTLSNKEIVHGFVLAVLNRCAAFLAMQAGLLPFLALNFIRDVQYFGLYGGSLAGWEWGAAGSVVQFALALLAALLFVAGVNGLIISLAVLFSALWRNIVVAASLPVFMALGVVLATPQILSSLALPADYEVLVAGFSIAGLVTLGCSWLALGLAERQVRK